MLFILDSSVGHIDLTCLEQNRALENLLGSYQNQNHLIFMPLKELRDFSARISEHLSYGSRVVLSTLYNKAPEYKGLVDIIDYKCIVYASDQEENVYRDGNVWHVPLRYFSRSGLLQSVVMGEGDLDPHLYYQFADFYRKKNGIGSFFPKARLQAGGGSGVPEALKDYLNSEFSPCICVTDSDKFHPKYKKSLTAGKCEIVIGGRKNIVEYIQLEEREVENIIPKDLLAKFSDVARLEGCCNNFMLENSEHWYYLDLKDGFSINWVAAQDQETQKYWLKLKTQLEKDKKRCVRCEAATDSKDCACNKMPGLGSRILEHSVKYLRDNGSHVCMKLLINDLRWERIGKAVFDFAIAPGGERVVARAADRS